MKITELHIEGFRSLKNVTWKPGDLNVLIGPNGSGKSNLLRALEMISAAAQGRLSNYVRSEGGMGSLVWDGAGYEIAAKAVLATRYSPPTAEYDYQMSLMREGLVSTYHIGDESLIFLPFDDDSHSTDKSQKQFRRHNSQTWLFDKNGQHSTVPLVSISEEETLLAQAAGPFTFNERIPAVQQQLSNWMIYQDYRTDRSSLVRQAAVSRSEWRVASDGQNLVTVLFTLYANDRTFKQLVNSAMLAAFGSDYEELVLAPDAADQRIQLKVRWKTLKKDQPAADLSDGTLRFLFLLAVLANPSPAPLIAIDEPETGLHPSMLPIVAELAVEASRHSQVLLTTHSDVFLDAFRDTRPTTTVARWENGETTLTTLSDDDLDYWLKDYSMGTFFRTGELEALA